MSGETNLDRLLCAMAARLDDGAYVFATVTGGVPVGMSPRMIFAEAEGTTLIVTRAEAEAAGLAHSFACRMITLEVHSSLDAVGFLARITAALAAHGMGVNPVSGYYHDHLFVPEDRAQEALRILNDLSRAARQAAG